MAAKLSLKTGLLFSLCMIVRGLIVVFAFLLSQDIVDDCLTKLRIMGMTAILPALGWTFLLLMNVRSSFFGGQVWWFWLRIVHIFLYLLFAYLAIHGVGLAWVALAADWLVGLLSFGVRYGLVGWFIRILNGPLGYIIKPAIILTIIYLLHAYEVPPKYIALAIFIALVLYQLSKMIDFKKVIKHVVDNIELIGVILLLLVIGVILYKIGIPINLIVIILLGLFIFYFFRKLFS